MPTKYLMTLQSALLRLSELQSTFAPPAPPAPGPAPGAPSFAQALQAASAPVSPFATVGVPLAPGAGMGAGAALAAAQGEIGQTEQPPGSNNSARIAQYRSAVPGGPVGPWCAYFVSWCAQQAGAPLGDNGQGFASVDALYAWAQRAGRAVPAAAGPPRPGDLIVWDEHIGLVENVLPDGRIQTIEGNSSNMVARRTHPPGGALGYVRMS